MSETISESGKSKSQDASSTKSTALTRTIKRLNDIMEMYCSHADTEYEFGVIHGLQMALDALEGK